MQSEDVSTMSTHKVSMTGPLAAEPSKLINRGRPKKPEFGNTATNAPMAQSPLAKPQRRDKPQVSAIKIKALETYTINKTGSTMV
jgi:hypothetical protein